MPVLSDRQGARLARSAALASIATALFLAALKGWAVWRTGSTAMLGSLADTALDLIASLATLVGVWVAAQPAEIFDSAAVQATSRWRFAQTPGGATVRQVLRFRLPEAG